MQCGAGCSVCEVRYGRDVCTAPCAGDCDFACGRKDEEQNEYRYISPSWVDAIAYGLTAGAKKHPGETWKTIPPDEHLSRAMRHINLYRLGDRSEPHIINASMRLMMAFCTVKNEEVMDALGLSYE